MLGRRQLAYTVMFFFHLTLQPLKPSNVKQRKVKAALVSFAVPAMLSELGFVVLNYWVLFIIMYCHDTKL